MSTGNSKLIAGLIIGAAIGAAIGSFLACDKKEEILGEIGDAVNNAKKKIGKAVNHGLEELDVAVDKANAIAHSAISRAKRNNPEELL